MRTSKRMDSNEPSLVHTAFFAMRAPLLPMRTFFEWGAGLEAAPAEDRVRLRSRLRALLTRPEVREAIFLAAPTLDESLESWLHAPDSERARKAEVPLCRYFARMVGRSTPFGLFAGCSVGRIGERTRLTLSNSHARRTRLDMEYLCALVDAMADDPMVRRELTYRPNSSLYPIGDQIRYAEARAQGASRSYHLVTAESSEYLETALERAANGVRMGDLVDALLAAYPSEPAEDVESFVEELVRSQILIPDLLPPLTGGDPLDALIARLAEHPACTNTVAVLRETRTCLRALDEGGIGHAPAVYRAVAERLQSLPARVELSHLFQVDMIRPAPDATLGPEIVSAAVDLVSLLHRLTDSFDSLGPFKRAFTERYHDQEVPLVRVLDEEVGIGFFPNDGPGADPSPLLRGLPFRSDGSEPPAGWGAREIMLSRRLESALRDGAHEIVLDEGDLDALTAGAENTKTPRPPLPDSLAVLVSVLASSSEAVDAGDFRLLVDGVMGPSGAKLLGRFCSADPQLEGHVRTLLRDEEAHLPDAIHAEIVHLPEGRVGNVTMRPVLRDYEIPILGTSGAPREKQIPVTDLLVSVVGDRVVLRSASLQREVVPCLTNAHHYARSIHTYRFLAELSEQGRAPSLVFSWGGVRASFRPRVVYGRYVLARATWQLSSDELAVLPRGSEDERFVAVQRLRAERGLPRYVLVAEGEHFLPIDLDNALMVESFVHLVKQRPNAILQEMLPGPDDLCAHAGGDRFVHELVIPLARPIQDTARPTAKAPISKTPPAPTVPRHFAPGSEWLYAKMYVGRAGADRVLRDVVAPVAEWAEESGAAEGWFFLRYGDPEHHLRVRFHGSPERSCDVQARLMEAAAPLFDDGLVWRLQIDSYQREVERYGGPEGIIACERIFHADSRACLRIIEQLSGELPGDEALQTRWLLAAVGMDRLLDDLGFPLAHKQEMVRDARQSLAAEFAIDKSFEHALGDKYRTERGALERMFDARKDLFDARGEQLLPIAAELRRKSAAGALTMPLSDIALSLLHMHANRLLRSNQRAQELVIYDFLGRMYEGRAARARASSRPPHPPRPPRPAHQGQERRLGLPPPIDATDSSQPGETPGPGFPVTVAGGLTASGGEFGVGW